MCLGLVLALCLLLTVVLVIGCCESVVLAVDCVFGYRML